MKKIVLFLILVNTGLGLSYKNIDYQHKIIRKEIVKSFNIENYLQVELKQADSNFQAGKFFKISNNKNTLGYCYIGRVNSCRAGGCSVTGNKMVDLSFEYFDYLIVTNLSCEVKSVRVFNYQATHGQEICSKNWLKQFMGYDGYKPMGVGKNIDAISGATISVYAIVIDIERVVETLKLVKNK